MGTVEVEQQGKLYQADYHLVENVVTVYGDDGQKSTQLGGMSEHAVAKMLLRSLIREGKINPVDG